MKLNQTNQILIALLVFLAACGNDKKDSVNATTNPAPRGNESIYGSWQMFDMENQAVKLVATLTVEDGKITARNRCSSPGLDTVTVSVTSAATIDSTTVRIQENKSSSLKINGVSCNVEMKTGWFNYEVKNNVLKVTRDGESFEMPRSK